MTKPARKSAKQGIRRYTLGRYSFGKISAVEGLHLSDAMQNEFRDFDRKKLSPKERRAAIAAKYGKST